MKGRKPQPAEIKEARGNPGRRPMGKVDVEVVATARMQPPAMLKGAAATVWKNLAPDLIKANILRVSDVGAFARYCQAFADYWRITKRIAKRPLVYESESKHGTLRRIEPLFMIQERLSRRLESIEDRFGLNPAARQQLMMRMAGAQGDLFPAAPQTDERGAARHAQPDDPFGCLARTDAVH